MIYIGSVNAHRICLVQYYNPDVNVSASEVLDKFKISKTHNCAKLNETPAMFV